MKPEPNMKVVTDEVVNSEAVVTRTLQDEINLILNVPTKQDGTFQDNHWLTKLRKIFVTNSPAFIKCVEMNETVVFIDAIDNKRVVNKTKLLAKLIVKSLEVGANGSNTLGNVIETIDMLVHPLPIVASKQAAFLNQTIARHSEELLELEQWKDIKTLGATNLSKTRTGLVMFVPYTVWKAVGASHAFAEAFTKSDFTRAKDAKGNTLGAQDIEDTDNVKVFWTATK